MELENNEDVTRNPSLPSEPEEPETIESNTSISPDDQLPPEAQGETHGGPLGCCLGVVVGIMLSLFVGVVGIGHLIAGFLTFLIHTSTLDGIRISTAIFAVIGAILFGYLGWRIGRRVYREYEPPVVKQRKKKTGKPVREGAKSPS